MSAEFVERMTSADMLCQLLPDYLEASKAVGWPGTDGLTVSDILNGYPQASAAGKVPDGQELCRRHMELIAEIQALFLLKGWLRSCDPQ